MAVRLRLKSADNDETKKLAEFVFDHGHWSYALEDREGEEARAALDPFIVDVARRWLKKHPSP